jgi:hypothetical protein
MRYKENKYASKHDSNYAAHFIRSDEAGNTGGSSYKPSEHDGESFQAWWVPISFLQASKRTALLESRTVNTSYTL